MKCSYCGAKIKRRGRSSGTAKSDAVQQCPKAGDFGRAPGSPCEVRVIYDVGPRTPPTRAERRAMSRGKGSRR